MNNTAFLVITVLVIVFASLAGIALYAALTMWQEGRRRKAHKPGARKVAMLA